ncbi:MAG: leucine-rich repeat domain-containing protein [Holosporales bacterium]|jgi:hypothetical protein|nr:leucine-rich repeat domain-containing protein [Holosporales bacterium]
MQKQRILGRLCAFAAGALSILSGTEAMAPPREECSDGFSSPRKAILYKGRFIAFTALKNDMVSRMNTGVPLRSLAIPKSVKVLEQHCFRGCGFLAYVAFEADSRLQKMGEYAFVGTSLRSMCLPPGVEVLEQSCFGNCVSLRSFTFEGDAKLVRIGVAAFCGTSLRSMCLPSGVVALDAACFQDCRFLKAVIFTEDSQLRTIGPLVFANTANLGIMDLPSEVVFWNREPDGTVASSCAFSGSGVLAIGVEGVPADPYEGAYTGTSILRRLTIPSNVEGIIARCFENCATLSTVDFALGSRLRTIGGEAFSRSGVQSVALPACVETIGRECFARCLSLSSITFGVGSQLRAVGNEAFIYAPLKCVHLPYGVGLGRCVFAYSSVSEIWVGGVPAPLFRGAYAGTRALRHLTIPPNVQVIVVSCFENCAPLEVVDFENGCRLERIEERAFANSGLLSVRLPASTTVIGSECFYNCTSLVSFAFEGGSWPQTIGEAAFDGVPVRIVSPNGKVYNNEYKRPTVMDLYRRKLVSLLEKTETFTIQSPAHAASPVVAAPLPRATQGNTTEFPSLLPPEDSWPGDTAASAPLPLP